MKQVSFVHYLTKILVDVLLLLSAIGCLTAPFWTGWIVDSYLDLHGGKTLFLKIVFFLSCAGAMYILYHIRKMLHSLIGANPFVRENVMRFRRIALACFCLAVLYIAKLFFLFSIGTVLIGGAFIMGCLFCLTLKDLFKEAIAYKEENELTV